MRFDLRKALSAAFFVIVSTALFAQTSASVNQQRAAALKPPAGAKVAIIVFEDLQCPDCGRAHPLVKQVSEQHKVPVIHRDFPLPMHPWARQAAIYGRYFESKSAALGKAYRDYIFSNQAAITLGNLKEMVEKFAASNKVGMPFLLDPGKRLEAKVDADIALGKRIGIQHTPTIFVVGGGKTSGEPFVEVLDRSQLSQMIQDMKNAK
ncbi:MAG TPA: thioredoxin domain-containing protein [Terriglobales bacterium]|nr:thioredoxin domain-containing protein [Terriglobales bacterium]